MASILLHNDLQLLIVIIVFLLAVNYYYRTILNFSSHFAYLLIQSDISFDKFSQKKMCIILTLVAL